ncbi:MAG: hypothetical protein ACQEQF_00080 [Bacillota bacterium]
MGVILIKPLELLGWIMFWLMLAVLGFTVVFYGIYYGPKIVIIVSFSYVILYVIYINNKLQSLKNIFNEDKYK